MSTLYRVRWEIDIEATDEKDAAEQALIIQRDNSPANTANVFQVAEWEIDRKTGNEFIKKFYLIDLGIRE